MFLFVLHTPNGVVHIHSVADPLIKTFIHIHVPCDTDYVHDAICYNCGSVPQTPQMRRGPCGERTLCNACGSKLLKGTYMHATAQAYPNLYPINHTQRLIYWPGKQTRAEEMAAHADTALAVMNLLRKVWVACPRSRDAQQPVLDTGVPVSIREAGRCAPDHAAPARLCGTLVGCWCGTARRGA